MSKYNSVFNALPTLKTKLLAISTEYGSEMLAIGQAVAYLTLLEDLIKQQETMNEQ